MLRLSQCQDLARTIHFLRSRCQAAHSATCTGARCWSVAKTVGTGARRAPVPQALACTETWSAKGAAGTETWSAPVPQALAGTGPGVHRCRRHRPAPRPGVHLAGRHRPAPKHAVHPIGRHSNLECLPPDSNWRPAIQRRTTLTTRLTGPLGVIYVFQINTISMTHLL